MTFVPHIHPQSESDDASDAALLDLLTGPVPPHRNAGGLGAVLSNRTCCELYYLLTDKPTLKVNLVLI